MIAEEIRLRRFQEEGVEAVVDEPNPLAFENRHSRPGQPSDVIAGEIATKLRHLDPPKMKHDPHDK